MSGTFSQKKSLTRVHAPLVNRGTPQNPDLEVSAASAAAAGTLSATDYSHLQTLWTKPWCRVYHNADQSINTGTDTALAFNSERYDTNALHDTATNNSRITIPTGYGGKWFVGASIQWNNTAGGNRRYAQLRLNGTTHLSRNEGSPGSYADLVPHTIYSFAEGDYIEVTVYQDSGGAVNVIAAGNRSPEFWAIYLGV